ncbi:hypothetical protein RB653_008290 [Dictyostelium firmibasis]|uniref:Uncharacterized protein n=1 Tax=Dictyostelium firmibasis TaxID=79012 RepID=A0AAN7TZV0_9MYCE
MKLSTVFLIISSVVYFLSCLPSLFGILTPVAEYQLSNYNPTDSSYNFIYFELNNIQIIKMKNEGEFYQVIVDCSYGEVKLSESCGTFNGLSDIKYIYPRVVFNYILYFFNLIYPIVFIVLQSIINFRNRHDEHGNFLFKYFRISLFLNNISSIVTTILVLNGYNHLLSGYGSFQNGTANTLFSYLTTAITSLASFFLILSLVINRHENRSHRSGYARIV